MNLAKFLPLALESMAELSVALRRIRALLVLPEVATGPKMPATAAPAPVGTVVIDHLTARWGAATEAAVAAALRTIKPGTGAARSPADTVVTVSGGDTAQASSTMPPARPHPTLCDVTLSVPTGGLTVVLGPVGCGKSSLLLALLRELPPAPDSSGAVGTVMIEGTIAYVPQSPWIASGTLRDNVTFGEPFDALRYAAAIRGSCMGPDISILSHGDDTVLGDRGVNLSGGQRARLGLARALYRDADVYLLDDVLAAVDARVGRRIYEETILGSLAGKTRILVTHQLQYTRGADAIVVLSRGSVIMQGGVAALTEAVAAAERDVEELEAAQKAQAPAGVGDEMSNLPMDALSNTDGAVNGAAPSPTIDTALRDALRDMLAAAHDNEVVELGSNDGGGDQGLASPDAAAAAGDPGASSSASASFDAAESTVATGSRAEQRELTSDDGAPVNATATSTALTPAPASAAHSSLMARRERLQQVGGVTLRVVDASPNAPASSVAVRRPGPRGVVQAEAMAAGSIGFRAYVRYWAAAGGLGVATYLFILLGGGTVVSTLSSVVIARWAASGGTASANFATGSFPSTPNQYAALYGGLIAATLLLSWWRSVAFFAAGVKASRRLHDTAFYRILASPLSFFDANPAGRVLNRFSKDLGLTDDSLPWVSFDFLNAAFSVVGTIAVVCAINPWVLLSLPPLSIAFLALRRYYMVTARMLKRLDATTRSPVFTLLAEALTGLPVIRAFHRGAGLATNFAMTADANLRAYSLFLFTSRWLGLRLDVICVTFLAVAAFAAVAARGAVDAGLAGLSLTYVISLMGAFQWAVRQSAEVENQMVSVERLLEYAELPNIEDIELVGDAGPSPRSATGHQVSLPAAWPASGAIVISNLNVRYRPDLPYVLRGVSASVPAGAKLAVVGRSGAGKSSLALAMLRLVEPERRPSAHDVQLAADAPVHCVTGIEIDGVDIADVPLSRLRRSIGSVPQDPVCYKACAIVSQVPMDNDAYMLPVTLSAIGSVVGHHSHQFRSLRST